MEAQACTIQSIWNERCLEQRDEWFSFVTKTWCGFIRNDEDEGNDRFKDVDYTSLNPNSVPL